MLLAVALAVLAINGQPDSEGIEPVVVADALCGVEKPDTHTSEIAAALDESADAARTEESSGEDSDPRSPIWGWTFFVHRSSRNCWSSR